MAKRDHTPPTQSSFGAQPVPQMPEGYYAGDQPNPNLAAFVAAHLAAHPYDPASDNYDVPPFATPIEATKATAIYNMHTYWSKKPHDAIRQYIRHYTQPGDLVLDPFCGSGGTALAALMEGRAAIAIDRSPAATFITKNYCTPVDVAALAAAFEELRAHVQPEIDWLYATRCDRCDGPATTAYTVYSQVFACQRCGKHVPLFDCPKVPMPDSKGSLTPTTVCPHCQAAGFTEVISTRRNEKHGAIPVLVSFLCQNSCTPARGVRRHNDSDPKKRDYFTRYDLAKLAEIAAGTIPHWYPPHKMMNVEDDSIPWGAEWREGRNFRTVADLFTKRNLWALAAIRAGIESVTSNVQDTILFSFTAILLGMSRMNQYRPDVSYPTSIMKGTYYLPQIFQEEVPLKHVQGKIERLIKGYAEMNDAITTTEILIDTHTSTRLNSISTNALDYIFTDPPYADKVQYGELNFVWEAWLGFDTHWLDEEIIVNEVRGKSEADWVEMMRAALAECYRVLKPGRWLTLCYHDTSEGTWALLQNMLAEIGFISEQSETTLYIDTAQKSFNQINADKVTKRDLVISFRKPRPGEVTGVVLRGDEDRQTFGEKLRAIIRDYVGAHPGTSKDRVYDEVVSRLVRAGMMEAHDFEAALRQVAEEVREPVRLNLFENAPPDLFGLHEVSRWYLRETELAVTDAGETAREDAAAAALEDWMIGWLRDHPEREGVHYSDLYERYLRTREKPRRLLAEWLPDYFFQSLDGGYRPPRDDAERAAREHTRAAGTSRRVNRYLTMLERAAEIPNHERPSAHTLASWLHFCRLAGLHSQGQRLYEIGGLRLDQLSADEQIEAEEDYAVCRRALERAAAPGGVAPATKPPRRSRKRDQ